MDDATQLAALTGTIGEVLGDVVLGTYLHGSAVQGGLRPASDVDLLVLTRDRPSEEQRRALVAGLLPLSGSRNGARPVEVVVVRRNAVRPWRHPAVVELQYGEWLRPSLEADGPPAPAVMPDLTVLLSVALASGRALRGPPLTGVLDPVPVADVLRATRDGVPDLVASLDGDERNVLLTLARVWVTLSTGRVVAKDEAATWALDRLPPRLRPPLAHARRLYLTSSYAEERWPAELLEAVPALAHELVARIDREAASSPR